MERAELESIMKTIGHQQHSSILGGMQAEYEELERMGYIRINWDEDKLTAVITPEGRAFVGSLLKKEEEK
ncbi:hypothetical protein BCY91_16375 [Pelobium manganitolerans]|uniref:Uncharacterized protein n=1 Tax=Pelobium manganitolerans TaxID=1842495 RepID=A0A419S8V1_9SPHI|nr:hypothetical protein [Pelobium manganitolerans]RKD18017.1 hypothetical protein BCY91_16375 [Pelobium manganitolerans]